MTEALRSPCALRTFLDEKNDFGVHHSSISARSLDAFGKIQRSFLGLGENELGDPLRSLNLASQSWGMATGD